MLGTATSGQATTARDAATFVWFENDSVQLWWPSAPLGEGQREDKEKVTSQCSV